MACPKLNITDCFSFLEQPKTAYSRFSDHAKKFLYRDFFKVALYSKADVGGDLASSMTALLACNYAVIIYSTDNHELARFGMSEANGVLRTSQL